jgi:acetone carboxylase gamma subunit
MSIEAIKHYEAALLEAFPRGATGDVFEHWNNARKAIAEAEKQERFHVATIGNWGRIEWADGIFPSVGDKMYSAPPQRKWVGLTDEEIDECDWGQSERDHARAIEAKLKEKNNVQR